ncbi:hypothetical protein [Geobacter anodireducens]|uniref:Phospholipase C/D domain-containing protein n=1 Tax=Geobacter anodireducens TaxID=1340425 RepID=A0ABR9NVX4_9BACT|nr:hypothetical protein [Geobacter anodireducens]ANA39607.1 hypothetical protein A2G06_03635 [Geobacter anodireducens]MBE2888424.1 hypothetical protein [Geobacter anodireducens]HMN01978.1 hypothetical protein [Geobacter anodireducens]
MGRHHCIIAAALAGHLAAAAGAAHAWHDETHLAVARAAGYHKWYNAAGPDIAKQKGGNIEQRNHYCNRGETVTAGTVLGQIARYNDPSDEEGHLYGAIIAALRGYERASREGKYAEYHLAYAAHYLADLSMPLHNTPYDDFNRKRHERNDGIVEKTALRNVGRIQRLMAPVALGRESFEADLAREIARVAEGSRRLAERMRRENRDMTPEEAYGQLAQSAALLEAVLDRVQQPGDGR